MEEIICYLLAVNIVTFLLYGIDKYKAKKGKWRISEATLLTMAAIGGSIGAWAGMRLWHHKTMHKKFKYGIPVIIILQVALAVYLLTNFEWTMNKREYAQANRTSRESRDELAQSMPCKEEEGEANCTSTGMGKRFSFWQVRHNRR